MAKASSKILELDLESDIIGDIIGGDGRNATAVLLGAEDITHRIVVKNILVGRPMSYRVTARALQPTIATHSDGSPCLFEFPNVWREGPCPVSKPISLHGVEGLVTIDSGDVEAKDNWGKWKTICRYRIG
jgi:hypothetical protein